MSEVKQINNEIYEQQQRTNNIETESSKLKSYLNFFAIHDLKLLQNFKTFFIESLPSSIEYDVQSDFAKKMIIKIINNSKNYQFIDIQARLGYFRFKKISIINIKGESGTHQIENKASGNFCTVYRCFCEQLNLAFKCFAKYPNCQADDLRLKFLIEEFCVAKLASCLEVGPKIYDHLGYDIMVYENCIQFCMQKCLLFPQQKMDMFESDLKNNLLKLHSIKIAHHDIKIENICYSNQFKKFVFIDFGISRIIEEDIGEKSFTFFRGSLNYCSLEMADICGKSNGNFIDLYYNDVIGLKTTLNNLKRGEYDYSINQEKKYYKQLQTHKQKLTQQFIISDIKYQIYQRQQPQKMMIQRLEMRQIQKLLNWVSRQQDGPKNRKIKNYILSIIRQSKFGYFDYLSNFQQSQQDALSLQKKTVSELNKINHHCYYSYFINQFNYNFQQIIEYLTANTHKVQMDIVDDLCLLSKTIQLNATQLKYEKVEQICITAFQRVQQLSQLKSKLLKLANQNIKYLQQVSRFLFIKAFDNNLKCKYFTIFASIINNISFYQLIKPNQMLYYYKKLLQMQLNFKVKIKAIVIFLSCLQWNYFTSFELGDYLQLQSLIQQQNNYFILNVQTKYNKSQMNILKTVLFQEQSNNPQYLGTIKQILQNQEKEIKIWSICNAIKRLCYNDWLFQELQNYYQPSLNSSSVFQYYCFYVMMGCTLKKNFLKLETLISKSQSVLRQKQSSFLILFKSIFLFNQRIMSLSNFINKIDSLKGCKQLIINHNIQNILNYISKSHYTQFRQLSLTNQQKYYHIRINSMKHILRTMKASNNQSQYYNQMDISFRFFLIEQSFLQHFGQPIYKQWSYGYQSYFHLRKKAFFIENIAGNAFDCSLRMARCFYILILLIKELKYEQGLKLAKYLYQISCFIHCKNINQYVILQFIFTYILDPMFVAGYNQIKNQNKQLYFQYQRLISKSNKEQLYFSKAPIFIDVFTLMYKYKPNKLINLINRTSKKLQFCSSRFNVQRYLLIFQFIFIQKMSPITFKDHNKFLYQSLKIKNNPYNIVIIHSIGFQHLSSECIKKHFFNIFASFKFTSIYVKEYLLKSVILKFIAVFWDNISHRKRLRLYKLAIKYYNHFPLTQDKLGKLFIDPHSKRLLSIYRNMSISKNIDKAFRNYIEYLPERQMAKNVKFRFEYNKIEMKHCRIKQT